MTEHLIAKVAGNAHGWYAAAVKSTRAGSIDSPWETCLTRLDAATLQPLNSTVISQVHRHFLDIAASDDRAALLFFGTPQRTEIKLIALLDGRTLRGTGLFGSVKQTDINCNSCFPRSGRSNVFDSANTQGAAWCDGKWVVFGRATRAFLGTDEQISVLGLWMYDEALRFRKWIEIESPLSSDPLAVACTRKEIVCVSGYSQGTQARVRLRRVSLEGAILDEWELPNRSGTVSLAVDNDDLYIAGGEVSKDYQEAVREADESFAAVNGQLKRGAYPAYRARLDELRKQHLEAQRVLVERVKGRVLEPVLRTNGGIADFAAQDQRLLVSIGGLAGDSRVGRLALYTVGGELLVERDAQELLGFTGSRISLRS